MGNCPEVNSAGRKESGRPVAGEEDESLGPGSGQSPRLPGRLGRETVHRLSYSRRGGQSPNLGVTLPK